MNVSSHRKKPISPQPVILGYKNPLAIFTVTVLLVGTLYAYLLGHRLGRVDPVETSKVDYWTSPARKCYH